MLINLPQEVILTKKFKWGYLPKKVRKKARKKAEQTMKHRRRLVELAKERRETKYAGFLPIGKYMIDELKLRDKLLCSNLRRLKADNSTFTEVDIAIGLIGLLIMGLGSLREIDKFRYEVEPAKVLGLPHFFSEDTARNMLDRVNIEDVNAIREVNKKIILEKLDEIFKEGETISTDVDTTGIPQRALKREGVKPGYCNGKKMLCYQSPRVNLGGLPYNYALRDGNDMGVEFFDEGLDIAVKLCKKGKKVVFRSDSFYASNERLNKLIRLSKRYPKFNFVQAVRGKHPKLMKIFKEAKSKPKSKWKRVSSTTEVIEMGKKVVYENGLEVPRCLVVKKLKTRTEKVNPKSHTSKKRKVIIEDMYLICTSYTKKEVGTKKLFRKYHERSVQEKSIRDSKSSFPSCKIPHHRKCANEFFLSLIMLAQTIMYFYNHTFLPKKEKGQFIYTTRKKLIQIGGKNME